MDFFEAQARAKQRTSRLVAMFIVAVIGTIIAMYFAAVLIMSQTRGSHVRHRQGYYYEVDPQVAAPVPLWQPQLFAGVALTTIAIVGFGSMYKWSEFSAGGKAVAESVGGRRVDPHTRDLKERQLLNVVEEMAIASGVPVPAVYILDEEQAINAFAAGLTTSDAVVTVTRGTLEKLTRDELQGVIGHEFSHILNGDMRLNLRIAAIIFGILVLGVAGRGILWSMRNVRVRGNRNSGGAVAAIFVAGIALLIIGYVGYFFGRLIQAAVSRQREFLADASSVQFTRNPKGLAGALKKIGSAAEGSTMHSNQSAAIGHFFFAQAFRSGFTGLWATHPPLDERIRAIDPQFDGKFDAEVGASDDETETSAGPAGRVSSFGGSPALSGLSGDATPSSRSFDPRDEGVASPIKPPEPAGSAIPPYPQAATAAVAAIGSLTPAQLANAQTILDATPARLRTAAQSANEARVLLYGLLLGDDPQIRAAQREMVADHNGPEAVALLDALDSALREVRDEQRLPLVQLAIPALRDTPRSALQPFLETLDELIRADGQVTAFEFAMQKLLTHTLHLSHAPNTAVVQYYSFNALVAEIAIVLSVLARASTSDPSVAPRAFAAGASQLKLIESQLAYSEAAGRDLNAFDAALDKLAQASLPIKHRTLVAAAHVVQADGQVLVCELELLRAIAAALDCPMPPLATAA